MSIRTRLVALDPSPAERRARPWGQTDLPTMKPDVMRDNTG